jgi:mRNA-degrading endonuclease YafQ of YafQ-DinJ toxin-antitoxin module
VSLNPTAKVLSSIRKQGVRALLMGGQACILYGGAEFTRDVDLAILADEKNLEKLKKALAELQAHPVYFPPLTRDHLLRGHSCHFRADVAPCKDFRIDIMSVMHGCASFEQLWKRRQPWKGPEIGAFNVLSLPDLVQAKKTQRDKDWPMVRRLVERDYFRRPKTPKAAQIDFWFRELRTPELLILLCRQYPKKAKSLVVARPLLGLAIAKKSAQLEKAIRKEEDSYRAADRVYWEPLRQELFKMRQEQRRKK